MATTCNLTKFTAFKSADEAIAMLERLRWPNGVACPHCGGADPYKLTPKGHHKDPDSEGPVEVLVVLAVPEEVHYRTAWFMPHRLFRSHRSGRIAT